jgi:hypothetical protein
MDNEIDEGLDLLRVDREKLSVASLTDPDDAPAYWLSRTPEERLQGLEILRRTFYGYSACTSRLQRVFEVAQLV